MASAASYDVCPGRDHATVTKSDSTVFDPPFRSIYVGTGGDVAIKSLDGNVVTWPNCKDNFIIPMAGTKVMSTNTTASNMVAIF